MANCPSDTTSIAIFLMLGLLVVIASVVTALCSYGLASVDLWWQRQVFKREQQRLRRLQAAADAEALKRLGKAVLKKTKLEQLRKLYEVVGDDRPQFIRLAMEIANMGRGGANTYYQNFKNEQRLLKRR